MSLGTRARGFAELTRPGNAVAAGVLTFTGAFVAGASPSDALVVVAAMLATVFATGAGNAINDYFDRDIDRINRPDRPIPRGAVTATEAKWFSVALFGGAVVSAFVLPVVAIAIAVVNLVALLAYTEFFKGLPGVGNVVVAALTGSTFLFGGAAIGEPLGAVVLCVLAALATLTREIVKDVEDIGGDREEGLRTLPIVVGEKASLWLGVVVLVVAVAASAVPFVWGGFGLAYLGIVAPADAVMLAAAVRSFADPAAAQRRLKYGMFLAAFAFIVGRATAQTGGTI
ncbi:geranylgeranylglycerol-phosphate geranylgeranyltransferase [Haloferax gibbonsii]|uniref:Digeranylgeranylglyceryl phosphate synthase n=1 Tax=Haloferax gibbonsii TaxID=35746 RepID=A0A0K1IT45_HALGI|nr:geranylgeranylglycerol-phosphate geranylgeranyltransferase [Haloferax gibbonsii]AKU07495.1 prenyltransferase [Haloferax gibbonsii]QOS11595.1 (S)-2,3-di-O-geranylgeranylglyceryl phosphate synthase [Haloferax gibbonsii]